METALAQRLEMATGLTDEEQRKLCFDLFNQYWEDAFAHGVAFDVLGTMSISAALFALVAKHGKETTAEFIGDLGKSILEDAFSHQRAAN